MKKRRKFTERIIACVLAALMVVGVVPLDFAGFGMREVKAADSTTIAGWTNKNNTDGIVVTENSDSIELNCTKAVRPISTTDLSNSVVLTLGESTSKDITVVCDITVSSTYASNSSGIGFGVYKDKANYACLAFRGKKI